ncbi:MAG: iron-containing redox enzyme family protein [Coxiellaceae bacterium]|nr:iron-containing redox enzyme family protein [Coxiellaceae bacterium]
MNEISTLRLSNSADFTSDFQREGLQKFLSSWDISYKNKINKIHIFNTKNTVQYTRDQKEFFVRAFYHIRGHFSQFLWMLGNHAPNDAYKKVILHNIEEEFGGDKFSHEQLYFEFAKELNLDITDETVYKKSYLPFIRKFNLKHLEWLKNNDWPGAWAAFSAYERLDNIDYSNLLNLARSFGVSEKGLTFFIIHNKAEHFDRTYEALAKVWCSNQKQLKRAFNFIASHQIQMWESLSKIVSCR